MPGYLKIILSALTSSFYFLYFKQLICPVPYTFSKATSPHFHFWVLNLAVLGESVLDSFTQEILKRTYTTLAAPSSSSVT